MSAQPTEPPEDLTSRGSLPIDEASGLPGHNSPTSNQLTVGNQNVDVAGGGQTPAGSTMAPTPFIPGPSALRATDTPDTGHRGNESHGLGASVAGQTPAAAAIAESSPKLGPPLLLVSSDPHPPTPPVRTTFDQDDGMEGHTLYVLAEQLDGMEALRIASENRRRELIRREVDPDGVTRGWGLDSTSPVVQAIDSNIAGLQHLEHQAELALKRALRMHRMGPWVRATMGIGEKQGARLLAAVADPYWNDLHDRPRTVSELWAYCGYHVLPVSGQKTYGSQSEVAPDGAQLPAADQFRLDTPTTRVGGGIQSSDTDDQTRADDHSASVVGVAAKRARGAKANWSAQAKMRAYLVAEACMKCRTSPYRAFYDAGREKYATAVHGAPCVRCGPKGKPAEVGSPISAGHQHARALRLVAKAVLKDLWLESKRLHEESA